MSFHPCAAVLQAFHTLYHTDDSVLLGAPTGERRLKAAPDEILVILLIMLLFSAMALLY